MHHGGPCFQHLMGGTSPEPGWFSRPSGWAAEAKSARWAEELSLKLRVTKTGLDDELTLGNGRGRWVERSRSLRDLFWWISEDFERFCRILNDLRGFCGILNDFGWSCAASIRPTAPPRGSPSPARAPASAAKETELRSLSLPSEQSGGGTPSRWRRSSCRSCLERERGPKP